MLNDLVLGDGVDVCENVFIKILQKLPIPHRALFGQNQVEILFGVLEHYFPDTCDVVANICPATMHMQPAFNGLAQMKPAADHYDFILG